MKKTNYQFSFNNQRIKCANFLVDDKFKPGSGLEIQPEIKFGYAVNTKSKTVIVELAIRVLPGAAPFEFEVGGEGLFQFKTLPEKQVLERICSINCCSILFPFLREFIADLTRRAGLPPFLLPPVNFVDYYESMAEEKRQA